MLTNFTSTYCGLTSVDSVLIVSFILCESTSNCFQPGEDPSRGLLQDYEPSCGPSFEALIQRHAASCPPVLVSAASLLCAAGAITCHDTCLHTARGRVLNMADISTFLSSIWYLYVIPIFLNIRVVDKQVFLLFLIYFLWSRCRIDLGLRTENK